MVPSTSHADAHTIVARTRWYVFVRWFIVCAATIPALLSELLGQGFSRGVQLDAILTASIIGSNAIFYILARRETTNIRFYQTIAAVLLAADILFITYFIYTKGGIESRSPIMYVGPIIMSGALFNQKAVYKTTAFVLLCYNWVVLADYFHIITVLGELSPQVSNDGGYVLNSTVFMSTIIILVAVIARFIHQLLQDEQKQSTKNLEAFKQAQAIAHLGSWEYDISNGQALWSDEMFKLVHRKKILGPYALDDLAHLAHGNDRRKFETKLAHLMRRASSSRIDMRLNSATRQPRYVHCELRSVASRQGQVERIFGIMYDVTEFKRLDQAKSEFVTLTSHQLRTPVSIVKQYIGLLLSGYAGELTPAQHTLLTQAREGNERQLRVIDDLLRVVRVDTGHMKLRKEQVDLVQFLETVVAEMQPNLAPKEQRLVFKHHRRSLTCTIDQGHLRTVMELIIENASKYSPRGTEIHVTLVRSGTMARLSISDEGTGIAPNDLKHIFEKFLHTDSAMSFDAGGNGLGLYWAAKIIGMHKGRLSAQSKLGKGTTFAIVLPLK